MAADTEALTTGDHQMRIYTLSIVSGQGTTRYQCESLGAARRKLQREMQSMNVSRWQITELAEKVVESGGNPFVSRGSCYAETVQGTRNG